MKKIIFIIAILFCSITKAQNWNTVTQGTKTTLTNFIGATKIDSGLIIPKVNSLSYFRFKDSIGSLVLYTDSLYLRTVAGWSNISRKSNGTVGNTIYTGDGTLNADRVIDGNGNSLQINNGQFAIGNLFISPYTSLKRIVRTPTPTLSNQYMPMSVNGIYGNSAGNIVDTLYKHYVDSVARNDTAFAKLNFANLFTSNNIFTYNNLGLAGTSGGTVSFNYDDAAAVNAETLVFPNVSGDSVAYRQWVRGLIGASATGGTVTSVSRTNGVGITATVTNATTTPNITIAVDTSDASILSRQRSASTYQPILTSGTNIKTINSTSLLGSGNVAVGTVTSVTGTLPILVATGTSTPVISIDTASTVKTGVVSTGSQSFLGQKTFTGTDATTTVGLSVKNSLGYTTFEVRNDGGVTIGQSNNSGAAQAALTVRSNTNTDMVVGNTLLQSPATIQPVSSNSLTIGMNNSIMSAANNGIVLGPSNRNAANSTGEFNILAGQSNNISQSGASFNYFKISPTINLNANATSSAISRGIYYNPTVTNLTGSGGTASHRAWENTSGNMLFGTTSGSVGIGATTTINASAIVQVTSTTQGILGTRMTTTQKLAIASPAEGLEVYDLTLHQKSYFNGTIWINY
jgi:hypothetical protein